MVIITQHDQPAEFLPEKVTTNPTQKAAIWVFRESENQQLTVTERQELLAIGFSGTMGRIQAWNVVKDYALGNFDDVGEKFLRLIQAWLVLGDEEYSLVFNVVRLVKTALDKGLERWDELMSELKRIFPKFSRKKLKAEIQAVKETISPNLAEV